MFVDHRSTNEILYKRGCTLNLYRKSNSLLLFLLSSSFSYSSYSISSSSDSLSHFLLFSSLSSFVLFSSLSSFPFLLVSSLLILFLFSSLSFLFFFSSLLLLSYSLLFWLTVFFFTLLSSHLLLFSSRVFCLFLFLYFFLCSLPSFCTDVNRNVMFPRLNSIKLIYTWNFKTVSWDNKRKYFFFASFEKKSTSLNDARIEKDYSLNLIIKFLVGSQKNKNKHIVQSCPGSDYEKPLGKGGTIKLPVLQSHVHKK